MKRQFNRTRTKPMASLVSAAAFVLFLAIQATAQPITVSSSPDAVIPDNNLNGLVQTIDLSPSISSISDLTVTLDISGGWNGDYYAYLRHSDSSGTGFAVLLNRVGEASASPYGSSDSGMSVTLSDSASVNIHDASAGGGVLSGAFQPDGRNISPISVPGVLDAASPNTPLNSFDGMDSGGDWTLFIADLSPGGVGTLEDWSLTVAGNQGPGSAAPDGGGDGAMLLGAGALLALLGRHRSRATV